MDTHTTITPELMQAFFAQYWGQPIGSANNPFTGKIESGLVIDHNNIELIEWIDARPLSDITDEEIELLCDINGYEWPSERHVCMARVTGFLNDLEPSTDETDFLRFNEFAMRFRGIPVDTWVKEGVVKPAAKHQTEKT